MWGYNVSCQDGSPKNKSGRPKRTAVDPHCNGICSPPKQPRKQNQKTALNEYTYTDGGFTLSLFYSEEADADRPFFGMQLFGINQFITDSYGDNILVVKIRKRKHKTAYNVLFLNNGQTVLGSFLAENKIVTRLMGTKSNT